ncbi:hypothetical protein BKA63DRAFT_562548 [Paraphoma chrysanthemicola]|nr:hypothetical protein BKA63DRAFT_562548 [Paraphoma chrysanthemicola]
MPENIIASFRFEGKAKDRFDPPLQTFSISDELILAARLTIVAPAGVRIHATYFAIYYPDDHYANGLWTDVPEGEPTMAGVNNGLLALPPGRGYKVSMGSYDYSSTEEDVVVTIELLALDPNVTEVTRDVILDAESEPGVNAIALAISEASFTLLFTNRFIKPELEVGSTSYLKSPAEEFIISGGLLLIFYHVGADDGSSSPVETKVAEVSAIINVFCKPAMVTTTNDTLQIQFRRAEVPNGSTSFKFIDETVILGGYASIVEFKEDANM